MDAFCLLVVRLLKLCSSILTGLPAGSYSAANDQMSSLWNVQNNPFPNLTWATVSWNMGAALFPLLFVPLTENLYVSKLSCLSIRS